MLRTSSSTSTVARASRPSPRIPRVKMSTTLNSRGVLGSGWPGEGGRSAGRANPGTASAPRFLSTLSRGTTLAPVPFVSVSSTQTFATDVAPRLGRQAQLLELRACGQPGEALLLEFASQRHWDAKLDSGLPEGPGFVSRQSEAQADHVALRLRQLSDNVVEPLVPV